LPPIATLITQVLLAAGLGVAGRGEVAAATAPLMLGIALFALGLPESLTHWVARKSAGIARMLGVSLAALLTAGVVGSLIIVSLAAILSAGSAQLTTLIMIGSAALPPALVTLAFRGLASGARAWWLVSLERVLGAIAQLTAVAALSMFGLLDPLTSTIAIASSTFVGLAVYLIAPAWWRAVARAGSGDGSPTVHLFSYAWRFWAGSAAGVALTRLDQVLLTPLASVEALGIYVVAINISNATLVFNSAVRDVIFSVESHEPRISRVGLAARLSTFVALLIGIVVLAVAPFAVPMLFGSDFGPSVPLVAILVLATVLGNPGSVAAVALSARGRPGLRSLALGIGVLLYLVAMFTLVPWLGALDAALSMLVATAVPSTIAIYWLRRHFGVPMSEFYGLRRSDIRALAVTVRNLLSRRRP